MWYTRRLYMKNCFNKSTKWMNYSSSAPIFIQISIRMFVVLSGALLLVWILWAAMFVAAMQRRRKQHRGQVLQQQRQGRIRTCTQRSYRCIPRSLVSADDRDRCHNVYHARRATARYPGWKCGEQWIDRQQCDYRRVLSAHFSSGKDEVTSMAIYM